MGVSTGKIEIFLGTQGDIWDTQWDMLMAFIGAIFAMFFLRKQLSKEIAKNLPD
jgi:putative membrane protein